MFWADRVAKEIINSEKYKPYKVDEMFTPSGFMHIGNLRGSLVHDLMYKALRDAGESPVFTYVLNDFDPIDGLPDDLQEFSKYLGVPLRNVPWKDKEYESFADYFASDMKNTLKKFGVDPQFLSSWDMYHEGKFNEEIKAALDNAVEIQNIYHEVSGSQKKAQGWYPLQVICPNCGKLGTTRVYEWDGETVAFKCEPHMVKWAEGCDYEGRISPFNGNGKLPWKVDWPAHWKVIGVTIEGAGKDHSVAGSSRDVARELCKRVFKIEEPFNIPYEFFTIGGKKMSSSKGVGLKAHDLFDLLPAEVGRFLYCRTEYKQEVNFDPFETMAIPDLFDEYDRCYQHYIDGTDENFGRAFELSQINKLPVKEKTFLPRFIDVANYIQQPRIDIYQVFGEIKGESLNEVERDILEERIKYAKVWLDGYAPDKYKFQMTNTVSKIAESLTEDQKEYLKKIIPLIKQEISAEDLQLKLYELSKERGLEAKKAFGAIYMALIGKESGPKAGWLLQQYPSDKIAERIEEVTR
ncbi:MAG: lysine--tRNA ligase [Candidatus Daviesbacteria bacterium]|nr:lysine--tRNA ligase [Candidatus Daviesbacteria bacterium]